LKAYKFELLPNGQQERQMRRVAGACRFERSSSAWPAAMKTTPIWSAHSISSLVD